jgi:hypothetical protein
VKKNKKEGNFLIKNIKLKLPNKQENNPIHTRFKIGNLGIGAPRLI